MIYIYIYTYIEFINLCLQSSFMNHDDLLDWTTLGFTVHRLTKFQQLIVAAYVYSLCTGTFTTNQNAAASSIWLVYGHDDWQFYLDFFLQRRRRKLRHVCTAEPALTTLNRSDTINGVHKLTASLVYVYLASHCVTVTSARATNLLCGYWSLHISCVDGLWNLLCKLYWTWFYDLLASQPSAKFGLKCFEVMNSWSFCL